MNPWEQDWSAPQQPQADSAAPWEQDWTGEAPAEPAAPPTEAPSYASRVGTAAGLGLKGIGQGAAYGASELAANPVGVVAGTADTVVNLLNTLFPVEAAARIVQGDFGGGGSFLDQVKAGASAILSNFGQTPISGLVPEQAMGLGIPGAAGIAEANRADIQATQQALAENKAAGGGGLGLDVATGIAQMAPAVGVGLATRSPAATAAALAAPMFGQTLAEGKGDVAKRAARAAAYTGAEFVTELPVGKLLTLPASAIVRELGKNGVAQVMGRIAKTAGAEGLQEAGTNILQDLYDNGALDKNKTIGDIITDAGYAGAVGALAGSVAGAPAAVAEGRQSAQATTADAKARSAYLATLKEVDAGDGTTAYVDAAGTHVGDTLDEANAAVAAMPLDAIAQRMAAKPLTPEQEAQKLQAPPVQPAPNVSELPPGYFEAAQQAPLEPLTQPGQAQEVPRSGTISEAELTGAGIDTSQLGEVAPPAQLPNALPEQALTDASAREPTLPPLEPPSAPAQTQPAISEAELTAAGVDTNALGEVAPPTAEAKGATPPIAGVPQPTNVQEASFDVNGDPAEIRRLYDVKGGVRIKNGLRFPRKLLPEFEQKAKEISAAPPVTTEQLGEVAPPEEINAPTRNSEAGRPGSAGDVSALRADGESAGAVGSSADSGRVRGVPGAGSAVVGQAAGRGEAVATLATGNEPDSSLTETPKQFEPTRTETWDDGTVIQFGKSPFPALPKKVELPTGRDKPTEATVALGDLTSTQPEITQQGLDKPRDDSYGLPLVVHSNGVLYIQDGHHRLAKQVFAGDKNAKVRLVDLDARAGKPAYVPQSEAPTQENQNAQEVRVDESQVRQDNAPEGRQSEGGSNLQRTAQAGTEAGDTQEQVAPTAPAAEFAGPAPTATPSATPAAPTSKPVPAGAAGLTERLRRSGVDAKDGDYTDARLPGYAGEVVDAMARLFKKRVVVFRAGENAPKKSGGMLFPADPGTIYLNADANVHPAVVFMHEMVHSMKRTDPKTYATLEKAVGKLLKNKKGYVEFRLRGKKLSDELVTEEMIADVMADHASNPQFWSDLYARFDDKNAWQQFSDYIRRLLSNVIDVLYPVGAYRYIDDFNAAYEHVVDAAYNHARAQHGEGVADGGPLESRALPQTETPEFKRWFGDSKVVDADGKPLVVYHGTRNAGFTNFAKEKTGSQTDSGYLGRGFYFGNRFVGGMYSRMSADRARDKSEDADYIGEAFIPDFRGGGLYPVYLSLKNPLILNEKRDPEVSRRGYDRDKHVRDELGLGHKATSQEVTDAAIARGYDGVLFTADKELSGGDLSGTEYVAFRPSQIKSAIGNRGTFDPESDSVLESRPLPPPTDASRALDALKNEDPSLYGRAKKLWRQGFHPGGLLRGDVAKRNFERQARIAGIGYEAGNAVGELERAVKQGYGKSYDKLTDAEVKNLQAALTGKPVTALPQPVQQAIVAMRQMIDRMSREYMDILRQQIAVKMSGASDEDIEAANKAAGEAKKALNEKIKASALPAVKQAYAKERSAMQERVAAKKAADGAVDKKAAQKKYDAAVEAHSKAKKDLLSALPPDLRALYNSSKAASEAASEKRAAKASAQGMQGTIETITKNLESYVNRSYRAFDDPKWWASVDDGVVQRAVKYLADGYVATGMSEKDANARANQVVASFKTGSAADSVESFIKESKLGAKDLSVLMRRKDVPQEIRALLGEYFDPRVNFTKSVAKMGRLIQNQQFLSAVRDMGMGSLFWEEGDLQRPAAARFPMAGERADTYSPLNGLLTTKDVAEAFQEAVQPRQEEGWYKWLVGANALVNYGKTVLSPATQMRNFQSAAMFALANGHFNWSKIADSYALLSSRFGSEGKRKEAQAYIKKLIDMGVLGDNANAGDFQHYLQSSGLERMFDPDTPIGKWNRGAKALYQFSDDFWKIVGYENEIAAQKRAGLSEEAAELEAAARIRNTYPTYSMAGKAIRALARSPIAGAFPTFSAEIIRNSYHIVRYAVNDIQQGLATGNKGQLRNGVQRMAGMALVNGAIIALGVYSAQSIGLDDDEEEAVRQLLPPWQQNSNIMWTGRDELGRPTFIDMSWMDVYGIWKRPITAALRDQPLDDAFQQAVTEFLSPFLGADIAIQAVWEVATNKRIGSNAPVYDEATKMEDIYNHLRKAAQPGTAGNVERFWKAYKDEVKPGGVGEYSELEEALALVGWRWSKVDPALGLRSKSYDFADATKKAGVSLRKSLSSPNVVDDKELEQQVETAIELNAEAHKRLKGVVDAAMKTGLTKQQARNILENSGIGKKRAADILNDRPVYFALSDRAEKDAMERAVSIPGRKDNRAEIRRRYALAEKMLREKQKGPGG